MDIDFNENGTVTIGMSCYISQATEMFGKTYHYSVTTFDTQNLFEIEENYTNLDQTKATFFHSTVSMLLYVFK